MSEQKQIAPRKVEIVQGLIEDFQNYDTIGIVQMEAIGANTVQKLRADLRQRAKIKVAKNTLMKKAIELYGKLEGSEELEKFINGPVAFLFTNDSPYQIANYLDKNKVQAPAKAGQVAPKEVIVPKVNTGFPPGTIISELNSVGLNTRIEQGTVAIPEDTKVLEPGDKVSVTLASILSRLGIEPFEVGLSLDVVLEAGSIIMGDELLIDFDSYRLDLIRAYQQAVNLSVNAGYLTDETAPTVISSAHRKALALAATIGYLSKDTAPVVLGRAQSHALAILRAVLEVDESAIPEDLRSMAMSAAPAPTTSIDTSDKEEEEEEEEGEVVEDDEGLGSLFG